RQDGARIALGADDEEHDSIGEVVAPARHARREDLRPGRAGQIVLQEVADHADDARLREREGPVEGERYLPADRVLAGPQRPGEGLVDEHPGRDVVMVAAVELAPLDQPDAERLAE